ncbi:conjugal transfer pilus assembly protein TraV [Rahnella sp. BIGb0236]|uniref:type IV conjugative transfer system lipoprotein TraV n=1 Tax=Rahnella sp. BIGb0236 TaxID=2485117 RepID=UPI00105E2A4B|nr:type IV conjugative transfer system lipoprotein TraV [Rahnella sp. BIGb0236]TDS84831.1 conjugal transfer pilus assembly protein TraV [Rahnella sp. BIGb0236]
MKRLLLLPLVGGALLLTGCAGVSGDLECNATTSDRCMTMGQANQKGRQLSGDVAGKPAAAALPALVNPPPLASVTPSANSYALPARPVVASAVRPATPAPVRPAPLSRPLVTTSVTPLSLPSCPTGRCDSPGQVRVQRSAEGIAHVWVAPWVDTDDVFHQPGRVSFVVNDAKWQIPQSIQ